MTFLADVTVPLVIGLVVGALLAGLALMTVPGWQNWLRSAHGRTAWFSVLSFVGGAIALGLLEYSLHATPPWWYYIAHHVFALLSSVGLVGLIFELGLRNALLRECTHEMRRLFDTDPHLAQTLSLKKRQELVKGSLTAHLKGPGEAIYWGVVHRYLLEQTFLRTTFDYTVTIDDLRQDISAPTNGEEFTVPQGDYYKRSVRCSFEKEFSPEQKLIGCILAEHDQELVRWFEDRQCLFREVVYLREAHRTQLIQLLSAAAGHQRRLLDAIFNFSVWIDHQCIEIQNLSLHLGGKAAVLELKTPDSLQGRSVLHEIRLETVISKENWKYPVHLVDPSLNPVITFEYLAITISNASVEPFLNTRAPFAPQIQPDDKARRITVRPSAGEGDPWVFPNSGALFTWDCGGTTH